VKGKKFYGNELVKRRGERESIIERHTRFVVANSGFEDNI